MKFFRYLLYSIIILCGLITLQYSIPPSSSLKLKAKPQKIADICRNGHCEPQIIPDCQASTLKISKCQQIAKSLLNWINSFGVHAIINGYYAAGYTDAVKSATIYCDGVYNPKVSYKRLSQHAFRRACDGSRIKVNNVTFKYRGNRLHRPQSKDDKFFVAFLNSWGTSGPGINVNTKLLTIDFNRGVRDCRDDNRHCHHFHISKPCYLCVLDGVMSYE